MADLNARTAQLEAAYDNVTEAEALFFMNINGVLPASMRLEIPGLGLEFSDGGWYIGRGPRGRFYYNNDFNTLDMNAPLAANYTVTVEQFAGTPYVNIVFGIAAGLQVEFFARDPLNAAAGSGLVGQANLNGNWAVENHVVSAATVLKAAGNNIVTITSPPIQKQVQIDTGDVMLAQQLDVNGALHLRNIAGIAAAQSAGWFNDRIVFYDVANPGVGFLGFFLPMDGANLGGGIFNGVVWLNI